MNIARMGLFGLYLIGIVVVFGGLSLLKGGLYITQHEGDMLHLSDIVLRMADGAWPHLDFMTPLGIAGFAPIAWLINLGMPFGQAAITAQILFAAATVPMIMWVGLTRFPGWLAYLFGAAVLVLGMALTFGGPSPFISLSMHYNRWCWALAFLAIPLAVLPAKGRGSSQVDGLIIGLAMSFFVLCKVTYAVALAPGLVVGLLLRGERRALIYAFLTGIVTLGVMTIFAGIAFWPAYINDLLTVSGSDLRPKPGNEWSILVLAPYYVVGNILAVIAVVLFRRGEAPAVGLSLVVLLPGFIYIVYQNFGNDPKWLALFAIIVAASATSVVSRGIALACAIAIAPSFTNMALSPLIHLIEKPSEMMTALPTPHDDWFVLTSRMTTVETSQTMIFTDPAFAALNPTKSDAGEGPIIWKGVALDQCEQTTGMIGQIRVTAAHLDAKGLVDGKSVFVADLVNIFWMFGATTPVQGGAAWYYGDLAGYDEADYLLVPTCPGVSDVRDAILRGLAPVADTLREVEQNELYTLYEKIN